MSNHRHRLQAGRHVVDLACLAAAPPVVQAAVVQSIVRRVGPPRGGRPAKSRAVEALLAYLAKVRECVTHMQTLWRPFDSA